jgi:hypothetical protein
MLAQAMVRDKAILDVMLMRREVRSTGTRVTACLSMRHFLHPGDRIASWQLCIGSEKPARGETGARSLPSTSMHWVGQLSSAALRWVRQMTARDKFSSCFRGHFKPAYQ